MPAAAIPFAALRADLDDGWPPRAKWTSSGGAGRAVLEQPMETKIAFNLGGGSRRLRIRCLAAVEGARRDSRPIRLSIQAVDESGSGGEVWKATLRRPWKPRPPLEIDAELALPAGGRLVLSATGSPAGTVRWSCGEILLPDETEPPAAAPGPGPGEVGGEELPGEGGGGPRFSILTPVHDPPLMLFEEMIGSVLAQTFDDWELCLVDDGSSDPRVREALERRAAADARIRLRRNEEATGISAATNAALETATGEYVALLDHDDLLTPDALAQVDAELRRRPGTDMVYSDEEVVGDDGSRFMFAKPHWSPDLLRSQMYTCHLGVYRRSLAEAVGGFRSAFDGSQDFDFVLRFTERTDRIAHLPRTLYRWRAHAGSTAGSSEAKPSAYPAARRALAEHLERNEVDADAHFGPRPGIYRVVHRLPPGSTVNVGIVAANPEAEAVRRFVEAVEDEASSGVPARAVVAPTPEAAGAECADADAIVVCDGGPFQPLTRFWLAHLAAFARQPGVAAVAAKALAPDGRVEHGGLAVEAGLPVPIMYGVAADDPGPLGIGFVPSNVTAVEGVVAFGGEAFRRLGGLGSDEAGPPIPDYCLRARQAGLRVALRPDVLLRRVHGPGVRNDPAALGRFRRRWASELQEDPYFDLSVAWPGVETPALAGA